MSTVLVTGASGFIGRHLCRALLASGYRVRGTFRSLSPPGDLPPELEWVNLPDLGPQTDWSEILKGVDYVVHLAGVAHRFGESDEDLKDIFHRVNALGTARLAEAVAVSDVIRVVFLSTVGAQPVLAGDSSQPLAEYGRSKLEGESALARSLAATRADFCTLRSCVVFGPGDKGNFARLIRLVDSGVPLPFASIHNQKSIIYVGNLVAAIILCLTHPAVSRRIFAISDIEAISTPDMVRRMGRYSHRRVRLVPMPTSLMRVFAKAGDQMKKLTGIRIGWDSYSVDRLCNSATVTPLEFFQAVQWTPPYTMEEALRITMSASRGWQPRAEHA